MPFLPLSATLLLMAEITTWAQCTQSLNTDGTAGPSIANLSCVFVVYRYVLDAVFLLAGGMAVALIIYGGYKFINSGGDPKQVDGARKTITYAILGLLLILSAFGIINFISTVTGVSCIKIFSFNNCANKTIECASDEHMIPDRGGGFACVKDQ